MAHTPRDQVATMYMDADKLLCQPDSIAEAEDYKCAVCLGICMAPVNLVCGHLFCLRCLKSSCPVCRADIEDTARPLQINHYVQRRIANLQIRCENAHRGCDFTGRLGKDGSNLWAHLNTECSYRSIVCPTCHQTYHMQEQNTHAANCQVKCAECGQTMSAHSYATSHLSPVTNRCTLLTQCPNKCELKDVRITCREYTHLRCDDQGITCIQKKHLAQHLQFSCPNQRWTCELCDNNYVQKEETLHDEMYAAEHIGYLHKSLCGLRDEVDELKTWIREHK